ncbi:MAG: type I phosphomannose isomerase catalytic subunit [Mariniphaga sp.]|nr:mannose-6-phosphate isomerase [Mariniphaga sp.]MDD4425595.1 mannose-6-phosphate isomerase [Mariniphaga sp.]
MPVLYPLKFKPIFHEKIWGGDRLKTVLGKNFDPLPNCGESWELSTLENNISEVSNGPFKGEKLDELIRIYKGELTGQKIYRKFGDEFPLLFKFIDANDDLSIQVHPGDEMAKEKHNSYGKTEMWYVVDADQHALINSGFNRILTREEFLEIQAKGELDEVLHYDVTAPGDVFFIPAGRVHAICKGVLIAEIQQTSDITYRIFDYNRKDEKGNIRELHTDLALEAIHFTWQKENKTNYEIKKNESSEIISCKYFTTNILHLSQNIEKNYSQLDSFIVYMNLQGRFCIESESGKEIVEKGETVLVPASLKVFRMIPLSSEAKALEVYIK